MSVTETKPTDWWQAPGWDIAAGATYQAQLRVPRTDGSSALLSKIVFSSYPVCLIEVSIRHPSIPEQPLPEFISIAVCDYDGIADRIEGAEWQSRQVWDSYKYYSWQDRRFKNPSSEADLAPKHEPYMKLLIDPLRRLLVELGAEQTLSDGRDLLIELTPEYTVLGKSTKAGSYVTKPFRHGASKVLARFHDKMPYFLTPNGRGKGLPFILPPRSGTRSDPASLDFSYYTNSYMTTRESIPTPIPTADQGAVVTMIRNGQDSES